MAYDGIVRVVKDADLTTPHADQRYQLGVKHFKNGNEYCYVYNGGGSAIDAWKTCVPNLASSSYPSGYTVTVTNASQAGMLAGLAPATFAAADYGFIITKGVGYGRVDSGEASMAVGALLGLGTDGGLISMATHGTGPIVGLTLQSFITSPTYTLNASNRIRIFNSCF